MFLGRIALLLGGEHLKGADDAEACVARFDDIVDITILGSIVALTSTVLVSSDGTATDSRSCCPQGFSQMHSLPSWQPHSGLAHSVHTAGASIC